MFAWKQASKVCKIIAERGEPPEKWSPFCLILPI